MRTNIESSWTQSLQRGEQPSAADLRNHLIAVHRHYPGFTESCALRCKDKLGRNSYEFLSDIVDPSKHRRVLDLACGSGVLLEICNRRFGESVVLDGLDMSVEELELARKRNSNPLIELHQGVAQNLIKLKSKCESRASKPHIKLPMNQTVWPICHSRPSALTAYI